MCTQGFSVVGEAAGLRPGTHLATGRTGVWSFWECITNSSPKVASAARLFHCQLQCCKIPSEEEGSEATPTLPAMQLQLAPWPVWIQVRGAMLTEEGVPATLHPEACSGGNLHALSRCREGDT